MNPLIIHAADLHLGLTAHGTIDTRTGINTRTQEMARSLDWLVELVEEREPDLLALVGDTTHRRWLNGAELGILADFFDRVADAGTHVAVTIGNHDGENHPGRPGVMEAFDGYREMVTVYHRPGVMPSQLGDVLCIPYPNRAALELVGWTRTNAAEAMAEFVSLQVAESKELWVNFHGSVFGAQYNTNSQPLIMSSSDFTIPNNVFSQDGVKGVMAGHIHTRQNIGSTFYPGSLMRLGFGEENDPDKGVFIWDGKGEPEFVANPHSPYFLTLRPTEQHPSPGLDDVSPGTYLRVVADFKLKDSYKLSIAKAAEGYGLVFCGFHERVASHRREATAKVTEAHSDPQLVRAYVEARGEEFEGHEDELIAIMEEADHVKH